MPLMEKEELNSLSVNRISFFNMKYNIVRTYIRNEFNTQIKNKSDIDSAYTFNNN